LRSPYAGVPCCALQNLDKTIDNKALHDTFSQFGTILSCKVVTDSKGESKGYGFVHFETEEAAQLAIEKVNNMQLQDKIVYVGPFLRRDERGVDKESKFTNLYVKNLSEETDDEGLKKLAGEFGEVLSAVVMKVRGAQEAGGGGWQGVEGDDCSTCHWDCRWTAMSWTAAAAPWYNMSSKLQG
jgi:polyadenylate-binding protein